VPASSEELELMLWKREEETWCKNFEANKCNRIGYSEWLSLVKVESGAENRFWEF